MSQNYTLKGRLRERIGKGSTRRLRRSGQIPAIIYGESMPPLAISLFHKDIHYKIHAGGFRTTVMTVDIENQKIQVLPKDYQLDPVCDTPIHIDLLRVSSESVVNVNIPVRFLNEDACPGLRQGGVLNIVRHEIELIVPATSIPEAIEINLTGYEIGNSIHISAINLPKGVKSIIQDRDFTIATIAAPASFVSEEKKEDENNNINDK